MRISSWRFTLKGRELSALTPKVLVEPANRNERFTDSFTLFFMNLSNIDIGKEIRQIIEQKGIKIVWLAKQVGYDDSNLNKMLHKKHIYPELLLSISIALKTNLFEQYNQEILKAISTSEA
ncbi:MAG: hypothetical protein LBC68_07570 [Prevotellaceae bacterium]|nr:hypothetical protein [Prevotellaceae bacterium]